MRVMYAQDREANAKTRNIGTIESFLLMTEWQTRDLHFPPDDDGWGFEIQDSGQNRQGTSPSTYSTKKTFWGGVFFW